MLGELSGASEADSSYGGIKRLQEYPRVVPQMEKDLSSKSAVRARTDNDHTFWPLLLIRKDPRQLA